MADSEAKLDLSRVLNNTFGVIGRNPIVFLGLSFLIVALPQLLIQYLIGAGDPAAQAQVMTSLIESPTAIVGSVGGWFVMIIMSVLLQATLIVATISDLDGREVNLGHCFNQALAKLLPLIGLGILFTLGIMLGFLLLIIPGILLYLMWIVAAPVMMAENTGIVDSLKRSAQLTKGSKRWILLFLVIVIVISMVLGLFTAPLAFVSIWLTLIAGALLNTLTGAIQGAGIASIYVDLRTAKEGTDTGALADVFS